MHIISVLGDACITVQAREELKQYGKVKLVSLNLAPTDLIAQLSDTTILVSELFRLDKDFLEQLVALECIVLATTGCDDVDFGYVKSRNITVCYSPGYATEAVAEHTIALMLTSLRFVCAANQYVKTGLFDSCSFQGYELSKKRLGIIGAGRIGRRVSQIAECGFGMQVSFFDKGMSQDELNALLELSDVISLHMPLTTETYHMISHKQFSRMKQGVVIINTARGGIIDESALIEALRSGKVQAAGLDVLEVEPAEKSNPLLSFPNVVITPHIAYKTHEAMHARSRIVVENIAAFLEGRPCNLVCN